MLGNRADLDPQGVSPIAASQPIGDLGAGMDTRMVDAVLRRSDKAAVPTNAPGILWLHIGADELVVSRGAGDTAGVEHRLDLGTLRIAREFFQHEPPTAREIEHAIDAVEEQIIRLGPQGDAGLPLENASESLQP